MSIKKRDIMDFVECLKTSPAMLTVGSVDTRFEHEFGLTTSGRSAFVHLFSSEGRIALAKMYSSYMEVAAEHDMPMVVHTTTWRAHPDAIARHRFDRPGDLRRINIAAADFLLSRHREVGAKKNVYIAGYMGARVDGYDPAGAPDAATAESYNRDQAAMLAECGVDLLKAGTIAGVDGLLGLGRALAATDLHYILAPVIDPTGTMPDGTPLAEAVERVDAGTSRPPLNFIINCVHPTHFAEAAAGPAWPGQHRSG